MAQVMAQKGCQLLVYPGAFNMTTGPAHWQLLQQARALDGCDAGPLVSAHCADGRLGEP